jgi:hypothetical protein
VRQAAREMRDKIREAARDVRNRAHEEGRETTQSDTQSNTQSADGKPATDSQSARFAPGATVKLNREDAIREILAAVKDGRLEPDEADDLINAWMEVNRTTDAHH